MTSGHDITSRHALTLLTWCAAASLGLLFMKANPTPNLTLRGNTPVHTHVAFYLSVVAVAGALVAWHLAPRRSWAWLLLAGALCAVPDRVVWLISGPSIQWMSVLTTCAPAFTLVGVLGAATQVWRAGRQAMGAALLGVTVAVQLVGPLVITNVLLLPADWKSRLTAFSVAILVLAAVAGAGAVVALVTGPTLGPPGDRPDRRTTVAGALAAACPLLILVWRPDTDAFNPAGLKGDPDYLLYVGLVLLAVGVALGAPAGPRVLLAAVSAGLLIGSFTQLIRPVVGVLRNMPVLAVVAAVGSVLLGFAAALSRRRDRIGTTGLLVVALGLFVLFGLLNSDSDLSSYRTFIEVLTPVLLVVGVVAAVTCTASIGVALGPKGESPAVFVGVAIPFTLGAALLCTHFAVTGPEDRAPFTNLLPPLAGALLLSALALMLLVNRARRAYEPVSDARPAADVLSD